MLHGDAPGLLIGAVALGAVHGIEPGHGWPVAASYALDQANTWVYGFAASLILGVGHLISSIAMVLVFFYAKSYFDLTQINEPIQLVGTIFVGGPVSIVAGLVLIALGIREYQHGHAHAGPDEKQAHHSHQEHTHDRDHSYSHEHNHDHNHRDSHNTHRDGLLSGLRTYLPFGGGDAHSQTHEGLDESADRGLLGIAWVAFLLGFAHEEEFEIIALCAGSASCLELMVAYALTVIVGIVGLTMLLIAGYEQYEDRVETYTPYLPVVSATVLVIMGVGFVTGFF